MFCNAKQTILRSVRYRKKPHFQVSIPDKFRMDSQSQCKNSLSYAIHYKEKTRNGTEVERKKETIK